METYLTIAELAVLIKLSEQTVRRYVLNREIPFHKIKKVVRFRPSEIEKWIESGGTLISISPDEGKEGDLFAALNENESERQ